MLENPSATLLINDFDVSPAYDILVEGCLEAGIKIDAIGIQSHMHQGYWGVEKTLKVLEQFSHSICPSTSQRQRWSQVSSCHRDC